MTTKNEITGDKIQSKPSSKAYLDNFDRIFKPQKIVTKQDAQQLKDDFDFNQPCPEYEVYEARYKECFVSTRKTIPSED